MAYIFPHQSDLKTCNINDNKKKKLPYSLWNNKSPIPPYINTKELPIYYTFRISTWYFLSIHILTNKYYKCEQLCVNEIFLFIFRLAAPLQPGQSQMSQSMSGANSSGGGGGGGGGPGGQHCQIGGSSPLVMPVFPLRNSHSANAPHYSPYSPSR